jgi:hypothetical protein
MKICGIMKFERTTTLGPNNDIKEKSFSMNAMSVVWLTGVVLIINIAFEVCTFHYNKSISQTQLNQDERLERLEILNNGKEKRHIREG